MIGSEREALIDQVARERTTSPYGGPLAMLALVLVLWVSARVAMWESPLQLPASIAGAVDLLAEASPAMPSALAQSRDTAQPDYQEVLAANRLSPDFVSRSSVLSMAPRDYGRSATSFGSAATRLAGGHQMLWQAALTSDFRGVSWRAKRTNFERQTERQAGVPVLPGTPPFGTTAKDTAGLARVNRWTLDTWAFWRQGSGAVTTSQGRVPIYGANQAGANLQYRIAPASGHDPRLYVRAYRALIDEPETELAAGVSAKPLSKFPVRLAAELRATDNQLGSDFRPAAYAITEIHPIALPVGLSAEVFAGAGYVGGEADTAFVDGLASVTGELASFDLMQKNDVRLSMGAGVWGGAQRNAERIDVGPTMRLDLSLGSIPARVSLDYRERVGGDAVPDSGLAATLSTQF